MRTHAIFWLAGALLAAGCGSKTTGSEGAPSAEAEAESEPPADSGAAQEDELGTLVQAAKRIRANPEQTEAILAEFGWTVEQYRDHMVEVASDPQTAERFVALLGG